MSENNEEAGRLPFPPVVLGIAGCSGSGKTTLAAELARTLGGVHFHLDNYYLDLGHLPPEERAGQNFDDPALIESGLLADHVAALARGEAIARPIYDFAHHTLYQLRVYVETPDEVCFERRLRRDVCERGRTPESVKGQYEATVWPASVAYVRPSRANADLSVDGTGALDWKVERVLNEMRDRGLLLGAG